jgi:MoaA/NifB/PqqE/SkfB family radical SAM enzyme
MERLAAKYAALQMFRALGRPRPLPVSLAYSVTHRCNARCKTCGVAGGLTPDMDTDSWMRVFKSLGRAPVWITVTGGEPFMREDIADLLQGMLRHAKPAYITIATNGSLSNRIVPIMRRLAKDFPDTDIIANISLDGIGAQHDRVRGMDGSFDAAVDTFHHLRIDQPPNLHAGFHTVISKYNADAVPDLVKYVTGFRPDAHGLEVAQSRAELNVAHRNLAPSPEAVRALMPVLLEAAESDARPTSVQRARRAFRRRYYALSAKALEKGRQPIPCWAGFASAYITPDGNLWACPTAGSSLGSLRAADFDFTAVWRSAQAARARRDITAGKCSCALANALFTSMILDPATALHLAADIGWQGLGSAFFK